MVAVAVPVPSLPCQRGMMSAGWLVAISARLNQACSAPSSGRVPLTMSPRVRVAVDDDLTAPVAIALDMCFASPRFTIISFQTGWLDSPRDGACVAKARLLLSNPRNHPSVSANRLISRDRNHGWS